jgi:hypothetical protein
MRCEERRHRRKHGYRADSIQPVDGVGSEQGYAGQGEPQQRVQQRPCAQTRQPLPPHIGVVAAEQPQRELDRQVGQAEQEPWQEGELNPPRVN